MMGCLNVSRFSTVFLAVEFAAVLLVAGFSGCSRGPSIEERVASTTDSNIKRVTKMYSMFMKNNDWQGPADEEELRTYIGKLNVEQLENMGIDAASLDSLFVSERDQKPLKIRWHIQGTFRSQQLAVIFESSPSNDGTYQVGFSGLIVKEVDQSEYDRLWAGKADEADENNLNRR